MISRIVVILFLTVSATSIVSAQSQPKQLNREEEQKKKEELRKKIKEHLDGARSYQLFLYAPEVWLLSCRLHPHTHLTLWR